MKTKQMMYAALFAALTAAVSWVRIPLGFTPVPITLQTLLVLLSGAVLGPTVGALAQVLYLVVGALGLPVFAGGSSGIGVLLGPTGGYLFSYPLAAFAVGYFAKNKDSIISKISLGLVALLSLIAYVDLLFNIGIMKMWDKAAESYVSVTASLNPATRIAWLVATPLIIGIFVWLFMYLKKNKQVSLGTVFSMFVGTMIIYVLGSIQGKFVTGLPWSTIFLGWVLPFIIGDTIKLFVAAYLSEKVKLP